jgi:diguanylate cyclase (GGDEF)-like protein
MAESSTALAQSFQARTQSKERRSRDLLVLAFLFNAVLGVGLVEAFYPEVLGKYTHYHPNLLQLSQTLFALAAVNFLLLLIVLRDSRALRKASAELLAEVSSYDSVERMALLDPVTGTFTKRYLEEIIPREVARAERRESGLAFVKLFLEGFDTANDRLGFETGEKILKQAAQLLKRCFRPTDVLIRSDKSEFLVILPETGRQSALVAVRRLFTKVEEWNQKKPVPGFVMQFSVGVSDHVKGRDVRDALAAADTRVELYRDQQFSGA